MAHTRDNYSDKDYKAVILLMTIPQTSVCQPAQRDASEFNQWWHEMTEQIQSGNIALNVGEQYKQDLLCPIHDEIERLAELEDDWDAEGAVAVASTSIVAAQAFIQILMRAAGDDKKEWALPSVNATVDGGVQLYWFTQSGQTALTFRPGRRDMDVQLKPRHAPGTNTSVPVTEAVQIALRAMRDA